MHNPEKFQDRLAGPQPGPPGPPAFTEVPVTDERVLNQYVLIESAQNVLAGMLTMITPEGAIGFDQEKRCFQVAIQEESNEVVEDSVAGAEEVPQLGATPVDSDKPGEEAGDK